MHPQNYNNLMIGFFGSSHHHSDFGHKIQNIFQKKSTHSRLIQTDNFSVFTLDGSVSEKNGIFCCITGDPFWTASIVKELASEQGHAIALITAYKELGDKLFNILKGNFSFTLYDKTTERLLLSTDKIGQQHLFYCENEGSLFFGTALNVIKQIVSNNPFEIDRQSLFDYFYFHSIPSPRSIYKRLHKLVGGHYIDFKNRRLQIINYWQPEFNESRTASLKDLSEELFVNLSNSIRQYSQSQQVGAFLSGGLDSSTVAGMLAKTSSHQAKTFSIGFNVNGYDETEFAQIAAKHFDTQHHEYYVTPDDVVTMIPLIAESCDEPFGNSSALPTYFCAKLAKDNDIKLMLGGDGGDEIFAGNERYAKQHIFEHYQKIPESIRHRLLEPLFLNPSKAKNISLFNKVNSYIRQAKLPLPDRMETYNFLHRLEIDSMFTPEFIENLDLDDPIDLLRTTYNLPTNATTLNRMMYLDWKRTLHDNDLVKVNRMCELAGINVSYPLLSDDLIKFSCKIPSNIKLKGHNLRWFYKQAIKNFLPIEIINKSKHGFGLPFGIWTKTHPDLKELAYACVNSFKSRKIMQPSFVDKTIKMHQSEHAAYYGELIWVIMMLELWLANQSPSYQINRK